MSRFLRSLSTAAAGPSQPQPSNVLNTLPHKVRQRRLELPHLSQPSPINSALPHTPTTPGPAQRFPLKLEAEFQSLRIKGQFKGDEASARKAFLKGQVAWRSRIRGVSKKKEKSILRGLREEGVVSETEGSEAGLEGGGEAGPSYIETEGEIVGQRIYLPNVQIRLMRNNTPAGQAYDPTIATFRIPPSMTKTDLRSYLSTVYNLPVTFIRTDLYQPPVIRVVGGSQVRQSGSVKNYKRAVVGLVEPFHYPDDVEELRAKGHQAGVGEEWAQSREDWLNEKFQKDRMDENMKRARFKLYKGYRWRSRWHDNEVSLGYVEWCRMVMLTTRVIPFGISWTRGGIASQRSWQKCSGCARRQDRRTRLDCIGLQRLLIGTIHLQACILRRKHLHHNRNPTTILTLKLQTENLDLNNLYSYKTTSPPSGPYQSSSSPSSNASPATIRPYPTCGLRLPLCNKLVPSPPDPIA
jgi:large subunit ribosomal protein L23